MWLFYKNEILFMTQVYSTVPPPFSPLVLLVGVDGDLGVLLYSSSTIRHNASSFSPSVDPTCTGCVIALADLVLKSSEVILNSLGTVGREPSCKGGEEGDDRLVSARNRRMS